MAKSGIHCNHYHPVKIKFPNGSTIDTFSSYAGDIMQADIDPRKHPAWNNDNLLEATESINKTVNDFQNKFKVKIFDLIKK